MARCRRYKSASFWSYFSLCLAWRTECLPSPAPCPPHIPWAASWRGRVSPLPSHFWGTGRDEPAAFGHALGLPPRHLPSGRHHTPAGGRGLPATHLSEGRAVSPREGQGPPFLALPRMLNAFPSPCIALLSLPCGLVPLHSCRPPHAHSRHTGTQPPPPPPFCTRPHREGPLCLRGRGAGAGRESQDPGMGGRGERRPQLVHAVSEF